MTALTPPPLPRLDRQARAAVLAISQLTLATALKRHRQALQRAYNTLPPAQRHPSVWPLLLEASLRALNERPPDGPRARRISSPLPPPLDPVPLAHAILASTALAYALEQHRLSPHAEFLSPPARPLRFREADNPWVASVQAHLSRDLIPAPAMESMLQQVEQATLPTPPLGYQQAWDAAYRRVFTEVRESNAKLLDRTRQVISRGLSGAASPDDLYQDINDLYRSVGLAEQDPWYTKLVVNNALNRAWQEGRDAVSHTYNPATGQLEAEDWVWGYEWVHGGSADPRPTHLAMHRHVAPVNDPVWQSFGPPPIAHNCSCARYTITTQAAIDRGLAYANGESKPLEEFPAPRLSADQLAAGGIPPEDRERLVGRPVNDVLGDRALQADRFPRSQFAIPERPLLNPSGLYGQAIPARGVATLATTVDATEQLNRLALLKGWPGPAAEQFVAQAAPDTATLQALVVDSEGEILLRATQADRLDQLTLNPAQRATLRAAPQPTLLRNSPTGELLAPNDFHLAGEVDLRRLILVHRDESADLTRRVELHRPPKGWPAMDDIDRLAGVFFAAAEADYDRLSREYQPDPLLRRDLLSNAARLLAHLLGASYFDTWQ